MTEVTYGRLGAGWSWFFGIPSRWWRWGRWETRHVWGGEVWLRRYWSAGPFEVQHVRKLFDLQSFSMQPDGTFVAVAKGNLDTIEIKGTISV